LLRVEAPGILTTIQDLGRPGHRSWGIPVGGAMDRFALAAANRLAGNHEGAAALECTISGPTLVAVEPCYVGLAGADLSAEVNADPVPAWAGFQLAAGDRLAFRGRRWGGRAYIAVSGGLAAGTWLGSAATFLLIRRGGLEGRPLRAGDVLHRLNDQAPPEGSRELAAGARPDYGHGVVGLIPGPHFRRLTPAGRKALLGPPFTISSHSDRMGFRLEGPEIELKGGELVSFGLVTGAVQVPPSGQPIVLMADHQTAGGYPVVGTVPRADMPLAAQLVPGEEIAFQKTTVEKAQAEWRRLRSLLDGI
jgi:antagonist of KipI